MKLCDTIYEDRNKHLTFFGGTMSVQFTRHFLVVALGDTLRRLISECERCSCEVDSATNLFNEIRRCGGRITPLVDPRDSKMFTVALDNGWALRGMRNALHDKHYDASTEAWIVIRAYNDTEVSLAQ